MMDESIFRVNCERVRDRIAAACQRSGRSAGSVAILPVTKTHPAEVIGWAARAGFEAVGENRVQEAQAKRLETGPAVAWELIGHLQRNKAAAALETFSRIQTVDSLELCQRLARLAASGNRVLRLLIQVNAGKDPAKFGVEPDQAEALLDACLLLPSLRVEGLMTIAPLSDDSEAARRCFARLREIRDDLESRFQVELPELSMGMSGDLEAAIAEGATLVRVGSDLFGRRSI